MAPRRGTGASNTLSPPDITTNNTNGTPNGPSFLFPRASSPGSSGGFGQFFSKPRWFQKGNSARPQPSAEPRSSTSSSRKHKISYPTDPRPILNSIQSDSYISASRSVADLSRMDHSLDWPSGSPISPSPAGGQGDLRTISRRGWSRSADDLSKLQPTPVTTSFQDKVAQYRNRSNSTASNGGMSSAQSSPVLSSQPFPSINTSGSPPNSGPIGGVSISISAPAVDNNLSSFQPGHVHTRSHSFTPRLPSKLSTGPSPKRKGSASSDVVTSDRDRERKESLPSSATRSVFPFHSNGSSASPATAVPAYLSPSSSLSPIQGSPNMDGKRSSQIVHKHGFINRLSEAPQSLFQYPVQQYGAANGQSLSKGWKPFKLELKGSKLYFYKTPSDRTQAVKELFSTELVGALEEEPEPEASLEWENGGPRARGGGNVQEAVVGGRKKRAFWGRTTHPDLVHNSSGIEAGTFEALLHEAVFATTFAKFEDGSLTDECTPPWQNFASAILLSFPSLVGQAKFEGEFTRCCGYLVSGCEDSTKETATSRVAWLAGDYLRCHGAPQDPTTWEEWRLETVPQLGPVSGPGLAAATFPTSTSLQAVYARTPQLGAESSAQTSAMFPDHGAGSMDTFGPPSNSPNTPWAALDREGLSRDVLLLFDSSLLARSLTLFHRSVLEQTPENITADFLLGPEVAPASKDPTDASSAFAPLFGSESFPHWLTHFCLTQILGVDTSTGFASAHLSSRRASEDRLNAPQTSRTHSRSEVISAWAKVAEMCRAGGDECSWQAITAAVCSPPVARLTKAWIRVDSTAVSAVESWVFPNEEGDCVTVREPRATPWGGDVRARVKGELESARGDGTSGVWNMQPLEETRRMFSALSTSFALCPRRTPVDDSQFGEDAQRMAHFWRKSSTGHLASKFKRIDQFMSLSFAAEPRRKGLYEPFYWTRPAAQHTFRASLIPLLFPEVLPAVCFIDRAQILRSRMDSDVPAQDLQLPRPDRKLSTSFDIAAGLGGKDLGGTIIPLSHGDLLLAVQTSTSSMSVSRPPSSRVASRPPSWAMDLALSETSSILGRSPSIRDTGPTIGRAPSIRVTPKGSHLERKTSVARRNSLPSLSNRPNFVVNESSSERPLRVQVQSGTLACLVDVLVRGLPNVTVSVSDDNGEMPLRDGKTRELLLDHAEYKKIWWKVFRSFVTPQVLFDHLRKIHNTQIKASTEPVVHLALIRTRTDVLETITDWLQTGGGAQDVLDEPALYDALRTFLLTPTESAFQEETVRESWTLLEETREKLFATFKSQTMRPPTRKANSKPSTRLRNYGKEPPDIDLTEAEDLVDNLDAMASATFSNVSEEDLFITADLLEVQSADRTGWFLPRDCPTSEDCEVQTLYSHIMEVEPSSMVSELGHDAVYRLLPPGIRSCVRAYRILRKWLISKLAAPRIGLRVRQTRMELFLRAIEISRLRNLEGSGNGVSDMPCVRSFAEAVLGSAVVSVESRIHHRAWQNVAATRDVQCDALTSLLSRPVIQSTSSTDNLAVDMSWLLERMLEIISTPDLVEGQDSQNLINFDKRRHLSNLITQAPYAASSRQTRHRHEYDRRDFERLNNIEKSVEPLNLDPRLIKEDAHREVMNAPILGNASAKKIVKPFQRVVQLQNEKQRRDRTLRDRLSREKKTEQLRSEKMEEHLNKAMRPRKMSIVQKQHRTKKSMSSVFSQFMRPISSAFLNDSFTVPGPKKTAEELDFSPTGKPSLVLNLGNATAAQLVNADRSYTFQISTEDDGIYVLQAINRVDMARWIDMITKSAQLAATRRLTHLGSSVKPQLSDHIHDASTTPARDPNAVFGVDLEFLLQREYVGEIPVGAIPSVIERCLSEVETRGLSEVGIYRIAGASSEIASLKTAFNRGEDPISSFTDIHAVCDLVKSWFRLLPDPILPSDSYHEVIAAMGLENLDARLACIRGVIQALPQANFDLLKRVAEHLDRVTDYEEQNHMDVGNLAIVFSPTLMRGPQNDFSLLFANMGVSVQFIKALISHFHILFDDADGEAEQDQEEEEEDFDPIQEEPEEDDELVQTPLNGPSPFVDSRHA